MIKLSEKENWRELLLLHGNEEELNQTVDGSKSEMMGIMKYRSILKSRGIGNEITIYDIKRAHQQENKKELHSTLQYLFIEPISDSKFKIILDCINEKENVIEAMYDEYKKNKNIRAITTVLLLL